MPGPEAGAGISWDGSGGPRPGPALPDQLALGASLLLRRSSGGGVGSRVDRVAGGNGCVSSGVGGNSSGVGGVGHVTGGGVPNGGVGGVASSGSSVGGDNGGVARGVARNGGGVSGSLFLLRATGEHQGGKGGGKGDLGVHVHFPVWAW